jgi:hypothetical protein
MRSLVKVVVVGAMMALVSSAQAAEKGGACKADADKLCKDVQPGEGRILGCLKSHQSELSPKCTENLKAISQVANACEPDVEKFCFDTPIGKGGIANCLKKHSADLSPDCKSAVAKAKTMKQQH